MNESLDLVPKKNPIKEHLPIPFMDGYELFFCGGDINDENGNQIQSMHLWKSADEEGWSDLTGVGFLKVAEFVEKEIKSRGIDEFVLEATDSKRQRVFEKWAERKGCVIRELPDWDGKLMKVFTIPK